MSEARRELLINILDSHHDAGEFVGGRIALLDSDGTITEVATGTQTVDPASGPVDQNVAWGIGSVTKTFVAIVVMQLAEEGRIDLDAGIQRFLPDLQGAERITPPARSRSSSSQRSAWLNAVCVGTPPGAAR